MPLIRHQIEKKFIPVLHNAQIQIKIWKKSECLLAIKWRDYMEKLLEAAWSSVCIIKLLYHINYIHFPGRSYWKLSEVQLALSNRPVFLWNKKVVLGVKGALTNQTLISKGVKQMCRGLWFWSTITTLILKQVCWLFTINRITNNIYTQIHGSDIWKFN